MPDPMSNMTRSERREFWERLRAHALKRLSRRSRDVSLADDFVQSAFLNYLLEIRKYYSNKGSFEDYMKSSIDSSIYHYYQSWGHRNIFYGQDETLQNFSDDKTSVELEISYNQEVNNLLHYIGTKSKETETLATLRLKIGIESVSELATYMGVDVKDVYEINRHLRSIVKQYAKNNKSSLLHEISRKFDKRRS